MPGSKFDIQIDDKNAICPYCKYSYQVEGEDYSEDAREETCEECGKKYILYQCISVDTRTEPDCEINGEEHKFELVNLKNGRQAYFCTECDKCKSIRA